MKIAGGLTIILVLGALDTLDALSTPFGNKDGGVGVAYDKKKGLTLKQKDNKITESHKHSEAAGNSHVIGSDGTVTDSEYNKSHQEDKRDETSNTRELSLGGEDGGLNYEQTKETSGTSQQIDEESSKKSQKQEESGDGYYYNRESNNKEKSKQVKKDSYQKKESKGFRLGKGGIKNKKTESFENFKKSETNESSRSNQELEEERIQEGDRSRYIKRSSEDNNAVKESKNSEINRKFSSDGEANKDDTEGTGEDYLKGLTIHYTAIEEKFESSEIDGVKYRNASGFVQEDAKIYSHVGGENWTKTGDDKIDRVFTDIDNFSGNKVNDPSNLRRKRHTINKPENENYGHALEDPHTNYGSEQGHLLRNNVHEHYGAQENNNGENQQHLGLQNGNENGDHLINYGSEQGHLLQNNEQHRLSGNEFNGAQDNINRDNHQHLGLQHGHENGDHLINYGSEQDHLLQNNEQHRLSGNKFNGAQENINRKNQRHLGLQHENENGDHLINYGSEQGHFLQNNEQHRLSGNKFNGAQENINRKNQQNLGLQHENENGDHLINYRSEQDHLLQNNEQHRLSGNKFNGAQENINRKNGQHQGLQHGHENGDHFINYGSEQGQILHNNENHRTFGNEHYRAPANINGKNHHYLGVQHENENGNSHNNYGSQQGHLIQNNEQYRSLGNDKAEEHNNIKNYQPLSLLRENNEFRNMHQGDEVNGNEHHVNHGSYGLEKGLHYSPSSYNGGHGSNRGRNNLELRNFNHHSISSENENYGHENHRSDAIRYPQNPAVNFKHSEIANENNGNRNYGIKGNYHSVNSRNENHNGDYERRNDNEYFTIPGKGNYRSSNDRRRNQYALSLGSNISNRQGQILKTSRGSENGNLLSRGRSYRFGYKNYGSVNLNSNSRIINNARNYLYSRRTSGSQQHGSNNGFNINNAHTGISHLGRVGNGEQLFQPTRHRQGVKYEDVRRFLKNNGRHIFSDHQIHNSDNHIPYFKPFNAGYRPINNGYTRRHEGYDQRFIKHGAIDLHHFADNTHYSTGNGRYVFIPGNNGTNHCYYDTLTGLHFNIRKIPLYGGKNVIVPGNHAVHPGSDEQPWVEHGNSVLGLDLGFDIFYIGGGKYRHGDEIIPAANIEIYLKGLGISGIPLTTDGLPLGLSGGHCPLDLGFGLTYQGDGTYKYQDKIISNDKIIKFCKSKHIKDISFTKDGFPENLFDGSLDSIFKDHLKLPISLGNGFDFIGNGHYKWKDQIIPATKIGELIKEHNIDIEITKEGLPIILFNGTLSINVGSTVHGNNESKEDDLLNPHGLFPYDVGNGVLYDGKGNYTYKNITIPRNNIIEFCKSHDLTNISLTDDGFPSSLFNDTEHDHIGPNWNNPIYLGDDLYYIDNGHYKYKNQTILASDIGEFIKTNKLNVHITKDGLPLGIYFGSLDNIYSPDEEDDVAHETAPINHHEGFSLDLGSKLIYLGNGSYIYDDKEIISTKDIIEFCKSHSITNVTFTNDGFPTDIFINIENGISGSHGKFPINLGDDLLYYESGHYSHKNKTITIGEISEYIKENNLNVSITDFGLPSQLVAENFDSDFDKDDNKVPDANSTSLLDIYGDFPYDLQSDIYYLGNGSYRCDNEIIDANDIINYCKSHNISDIVFTEDGFPASLFNKTISDEGSDRKFPINLGNGIRFLGHGHYEYENQIYPALHFIDIVKKLSLNISLTDDGIAVKLLDKSEISNSDSTPEDLGKDDHNDNHIEPSHEKEAKECPKGPIDLGEDIVYIGDCHYMYLDHVIPAKYILGLLDILHIHDIQLPVGPDDDFADKGETNDTESKDDHILDLGFDIMSLGNGTYKYKNRYIPGECYTDFLKILGLKIQLSEDSEILVEDIPKSDRNEEEILSLIDELLKKNDSKTTESHSPSTNDDNTSEDTKNQNDSSPGQKATNSKKPGKDDDKGSSPSDSGYSTNNSNDVKNDSQPSAFDTNEHDVSSDDSTDSLSGSNSNNTSSVTSIDDTSKDSSSSTNSSDSSSNSDYSATTSDKSSDISSNNSSSSNDTTTIYNSKRIDNSSNNSSTTENKDSSLTNADDLSKSDKNSASSDNSTINSDSFTGNSSGTETSDSSNGPSASHDSLSSPNESDTTSESPSSDLSKTDNDDSTRPKEGDSFDSDNSSSSSNNSSIVSESSSRNSSREYSDSTSESSNSYISSNDSDSSSSDSPKTDNKDSSGTNANDSSNADNNSSSSDNSSIILDNSSSNSSNTEHSDSSSSNDTSTISNDSTKTSEDSVDNSSTTENSNPTTNSSQDSSNSDDSSSSSYNSDTTSNSSSDNSSVTSDLNSPTTSTPGG